jgi:hypothetical protein
MKCAFFKIILTSLILFSISSAYVNSNKLSLNNTPFSESIASGDPENMHIGDAKIVKKLDHIEDDKTVVKKRETVDKDDKVLKNKKVKKTEKIEKIDKIEKKLKNENEKKTIATHLVQIEKKKEANEKKSRTSQNSLKVSTDSGNYFSTMLVLMFSLLVILF